MTNAKELLSDELMRQVEEAARAQKRKPGDLLEEAVSRYLDELNWRALVGRAEDRNRAKGISEEDVPRLVSEVRRENHERDR
jgi:predicted transcriptional regulator